jgi:hypothetical protein
VVRPIGKRDLAHNSIDKNSLDLATALPCPHEAVLIKYENGKEHKATVFYSAIPVQLPGRKPPPFFVVVKGFGGKPMMLRSIHPLEVR